jgi:hypothetical protein
MGIRGRNFMALADAKGEAPIGSTRLDSQLASQHTRMIGDFAVECHGITSPCATVNNRARTSVPAATVSTLCFAWHIFTSFSHRGPMTDLTGKRRFPQARFGSGAAHQQTSGNGSDERDRSEFS